MGNKNIKFRCDLALVSDYYVKLVEFHVDSSVRDGFDSFTNHSALVIKVPVTLNDNKQLNLLNELRDFFPEKTAIHRNSPSSIAQKILPLIIKTKLPQF